MFNFNTSTVKSRLYRLVTKKLLISNFNKIRGNFGVNLEFQKEIHGLKFETEPKIQNFIISCKNCGISEKINIIQEYPRGCVPQWKKQIMVGEKGNLTIILSGELGFDISSVVILTEEIYLSLNEKYNISLTPEILLITNIEKFNDFYGLRFATPKSVCFSDLLVAYKIYNKNNRVRCEIRANPYLSLGLMYKNIDQLNHFLAQSNQLNSMQEDIKELQKMINSLLSNQKQIIFIQNNKIKALEEKYNKSNFLSADRLITK